MRPRKQGSLLWVGTEKEAYGKVETPDHLTTPTQL